MGACEPQDETEEWKLPMSHGPRCLACHSYNFVKLLPALQAGYFVPTICDVVTSVHLLKDTRQMKRAIALTDFIPSGK